MKLIMKYVKILRSRFFSHSPFRLVHDITYECNCKCKMCERWMQVSSYKNQLTTEENFKMLEDAKKAGMLFYIVEGGEPLLHKELPRILQYAKKLDFVTTIITNGYYLKERYDEILPFTDSLIVSIDSNDELHDKMRGLKGLRQRAIEGIKLSKNMKIKISMNSVLCTLNSEKIDGLIELSEDLTIPIIFQPMDIYKGYNEDLRLPQPELQKVFSKILEMKKEGHKIGNSYSYLQHIIRNKNYICHAPKCFTYVKPNGNIVSCCDMYDKVWGNVKNTQFKIIFNNKEFKEFCKKIETCNKCSVHAVIETSLQYTLHPRYIFENMFT